MNMKYRKKNIRIIVWISALAIFIWSVYFTGFDINVLMQRGNQAVIFVKKMIPPDTSYAHKIIRPLIMTIKMSVAGTFIGAIAGLLCAFFYADNMIDLKIVRYPLHVIVQLVRTVPVLIIALICTFIWGIGSGAGTIAIAVSTWAVMTRIGGEDIRNLSLNAYNAIVASGAGKFTAFIRTILVQLLQGYLNNVLYILEANVRHAAILGYVGAGGIGLILNEKISWREYDKVGMILIMLFAAVMLIEGISMFLKAYLDGTIKKRRIISYIIVAAMAALCLYSISAIKYIKVSKNGMRIAAAIFNGIIHPDWNYLFMPGKSGVMYLMVETVAIAVAGTVIGAAAALILTFVNSSRFMPGIVAAAGRILVMMIRTVPVYVYGLIFIRVTGPGSFAGVLTIAMCSIGLLTKRFTVAVDSWDMSAWNAYRNSGIGIIARLKYTCLTEMMPQLKDAFMYRLDVNVRSASTLGLVGAGGIGAPLIMYMNNYRWDAVGSILIVLFVAVLTIEFISRRLNKL